MYKKYPGVCYSECRHESFRNSLMRCLDSYGITKKCIKICRNLSFRKNLDANLSRSSLILCLDSCGMTIKRIKISRNLSFRRNPSGRESFHEFSNTMFRFCGMTNKRIKICRNLLIRRNPDSNLYKPSNTMLRFLWKNKGIVNLKYTIDY